MAVDPALLGRMSKLRPERLPECDEVESRQKRLIAGKRPAVVEPQLSSADRPQLWESAE